MTCCARAATLLTGVAAVALSSTFATCLRAQRVAQVAVRGASFVVIVQDAERGAPVGDARIEVRSDDAGALVVARTDERGRATIRVPGPVGPVTVRRLGYAIWRGAAPRVTDTLRVLLQPTALRLGALEIRSRAFGSASALQASAVVTEQQLDERMAPSVAAILAAEPGVSARSNGPMATQPIIRGLGGDRVIVLEDGLRTGDVATTAADHAVTIEPATARRIEIVRGPAGLLYGSNTLGGVVNVVRDDVPRERPGKLELEGSAFGESVNGGVGAAGRARGAIGPFVFQTDGSTRTAGDTRTPRGIRLPFTDLDGFDGGAAASLTGERGFVGAAVRDYRTYYGVPSSYRGMALPGAHVGGVYVDVRRRTARVDAEWRRASGVVSALSAGGNIVRFEQNEVERGGFVGTRFGQLAASGEAVVRLQHGRSRGAVGTAVQWRDLRAEGSFTGTRPAVARTVAAFAVNELSLGPVVMIGGVRGDLVTIRPLDSTETLLLRDVRSRRFRALTGAVGVRTNLESAWSASLQLARAFRPPSIEELYSAGPHLANYAYEVGMPSLDAERGTGADATVGWHSRRGGVEITAYHMWMEDHVIFQAVVDERSGAPLRDPRLRRYVVYRPVQRSARLWGAEARATWRPRAAWTLETTGAMPRAVRDRDEPIPFQPSANLRTSVRRAGKHLTLGATFDARAAQRRVPAPPVQSTLACSTVPDASEESALPAEYCPTPGALLVGAIAALRLPASAWLRHPVSVTLTADNLLDTDWRDPLWRAKQVAPQPGRNVRIAVRVSR